MSRTTSTRARSRPLTGRGSCFEQEPDAELRTKRWKFLGSLPPRIKTDQYVALHASPRRPINEYIFPDDIYTNPGQVRGDVRAGRPALLRRAHACARRVSRRAGLLHARRAGLSVRDHRREGDHQRRQRRPAARPRSADELRGGRRHPTSSSCAWNTT